MSEYDTDASSTDYGSDSSSYSSRNDDSTVCRNLDGTLKAGCSPDTSPQQPRLPGDDDGSTIASESAGEQFVTKPRTTPRSRTATKSRTRPQPPVVEPATSVPPATVAVSGELVPGALAPEQLGALGLNGEDIPEIRKIAAGIGEGSREQMITTFGKEASESASRHADDLLGRVKYGDLDEVGAKLSEVLGIARNLRTDAIVDEKQSLFSRLLNRVRNKYQITLDEFKGKFITASAQIEALIDEVESTQQHLAERNGDLESLYGEVGEEYRQLGLYIAAGRLRLEELQAQQNEASAVLETGKNPLLVQKYADRSDLMAALDKRIGDLLMMQQAALQIMPMIRLLQKNNAMLVEKFNTIKQTTVPLWKGQFVLRLSLRDQQSAVRLAQGIDEATNEMFRQNAKLLKDNSIATAEANQHLVVDLDTLQKVNSDLISTVETVLQIQNKGEKERKDAEKKVMEMRANMQKRVLGNGAHRARLH